MTKWFEMGAEKFSIDQKKVYNNVMRKMKN